MKVKPDARKARGVPDETAAAPLPELPAWKAFVVQFSRDAGAKSHAFWGRVEHLSSGQRTRFGSREELLAILERQLEDLRENSH